MDENIEIPRWLQWAREIQALAQSGETYALNDDGTITFPLGEKHFPERIHLAEEIITRDQGMLYLEGIRMTFTRMNALASGIEDVQADQQEP